MAMQSDGVAMPGPAAAMELQMEKIPHSETPGISNPDVIVHAPGNGTPLVYSHKSYEAEQTEFHDDNVPAEVSIVGRTTSDGHLH